MPRPTFLIIGAMKAGTTTLYADLAEHPDIFMSIDKEPNGLLWCTDADGIQRYEKLFSRAGSAAIIGEASTAYAKRPLFDGIAARAFDVLGPQTSILYLVRDPLRRMISQYHHEVSHGRESRPMEEALLTDPVYRNLSRYDWQLEPWRDAFGSGQVHVFRFEHYVHQRMATLIRICEILGANPERLRADVNRSHNVSAGRPVPRSPLGQMLVKSRLYRDQARRMLPEGVRDRLKGLLLPKAPERMDIQLSPAAEEELLSSLSRADLETWRNAR